MRETGARACTNFPKSVHTRRGIICGAGGGNNASNSVFPRKIGFYSRGKIILSLLLRGKEGSGRLRLEAPGVLFSVLKRRRAEGGEDGYLANKQTEKEDPSLPSPPEKKRRVELGESFPHVKSTTGCFSPFMCLRRFPAYC